MKARKIELFPHEQNNLYSQCLWFSFSVKLAVFMNRHYNEIYTKFKCICRVELSIGNKHVFCSRLDYIFVDWNCIYNTFLFSSIKNKTKKSPVTFKDTAVTVTAFILHMLCVCYIVYLWIDIIKCLMECQTVLKGFF